MSSPRPRKRRRSRRTTETKTLGEFRVAYLANQWEKCKCLLLFQLDASKPNMINIHLLGTLADLAALTHKLDGARLALSESP